MLILPIKRKWFDLIKSGEKKEEYREIKPYYTSRFVNVFGTKTGVEESTEEESREVASPHSLLTVPVIFRNGYSSASPELRCECGLRTGIGREEWGAVPGVWYYILEIKSVEVVRG